VEQEGTEKMQVLTTKVTENQNKGNSAKKTKDLNHCLILFNLACVKSDCVLKSCSLMKDMFIIRKTFL
jgi:hypothetical protein